MSDSKQKSGFMTEFHSNILSEVPKLNIAPVCSVWKFKQQIDDQQKQLKKLLFDVSSNLIMELHLYDILIYVL
jgi:hypothetical protein